MANTLSRGTTTSDRRPENHQLARSATADAVDTAPTTAAPAVLSEISAPLAPPVAVCGADLTRLMDLRPESPVADRAMRPVCDNVVDRTPVSASVTITARRRDGVFIEVCGRLDRVGIARLRTALAQTRGVGCAELVVDLGPVTWWDHSLARVLAWARLQLRGRGQHLVITGATSRLQTEIDAQETALSRPLWRGVQPGDPRYRPETADQP